MRKFASKLFGFVRWFFGRIDVEIIVPALRWFVRVLSKKTGPVLSPVEYNASWKTKALEDFSQWLSEMPDSKPASESATIDSCDMFTLLSEFSALRQEIRFQNREQSRAMGSADKLVSGMREAAEMFKHKSREIESLEENIRLSCEKRASIPYFDVRDALLRGKDAAEAMVANKSFFRPLPKGLEGVLEGYQMAIRRMDKALANFNIQAVETVGKPFDAKFMKAIGKKESPGTESGVVVEEVSGGFVRKDETLRTARVIVAG